MARVARRTKFMKHIETRMARHCAILILLSPEQPRETLLGVGSGVLLNIGTDYFVLTVAHVAKAIEQHRPFGRIFFVELGLDDSLVVKNFSGAEFVYPEASRENIVDVCAIRLSPDDLSKSDRDRFLPLSSVSLEESSDRFVLLGLPLTNSESEVQAPNSVRTVAVPLCYRTTPYRRKPPKENFDKGAHFLLKEKRGKTLLTGRDAIRSFKSKSSFDELPRLNGMSGCGVWKRNDKDTSVLNGLEFGLRLVGIQQSALHGKYVKCTKIGFVLRCIYKRYPNLPDPMGFFKRDPSGLIKLTDEWR